MYEVDERSDIFALGGLLYHILTLQPPITGSSLPEMLGKVRSGEIPQPSSLSKPLPHCPGGLIPEAYSEVAMKALSFQKEDRYQTVQELCSALDTGEAVERQAGKAGFRCSPLLLGVGALACILIGAALALVLARFAG